LCSRVSHRSCLLRLFNVHCYIVSCVFVSALSRIRVKTLNEKSDVKALAKEIIDKCKLIHPSKILEVEQLLFYLQNRKDTGQTKGMIALCLWLSHTHTRTHPFNGPLSGTSQVSRYQKGKTNVDFTEARDSEWQWHQLGHMQVCTLLRTDNHTSTLPLGFLQAGCPSCHPTNSVKAHTHTHTPV